MTAETLRSLRKRVAAATGADRELDARLEAALIGGHEAFAAVDAKDNCRRSYDANAWFTDDRNFAFVLSGTVRHAAPLTASLDAAVALVERMLPGWYLGRISDDLNGDGVTVGATAHLENWQMCIGKLASAKTRPLALICALLDALIAQEERKV